MTKEFCRDCFFLVGGNNGEWICDETQKEVETMDYCPETQKKCYNCCYLGETNENFYCNCGDSENYEQTVTENDECDCFGYE